ncbi:MAG: hypothetical protein SF053_20135 [Bacteroidia bacterium]|nr:hypothetical protein [Bacteroidia bacterium]
MKQVVLISVWLAALLYPGCNRYIADYVPTVDYRGARIRSLEPQVNLQTGQVRAELTLVLSFRYSNPYRRPLLIPAHTFSLHMKNRFIPNGRELSHLQGNQAAFRVPADGDTVVQYSLRLDLDPLGQMKDFLGRDNYYEFRSDITLDLQDYLPGGALRQAVSAALGDTERDIRLAYGDSIRLPLMPVILPSATKARIQLVGEMEKLDFSPLRNGMKPFYNLITGTKVLVYAPTMTNPFRTVEVNFADHMMTLLSPVAPDAPDAWDNFKDHWADFQAQPVVEYPGEDITGLRVTIPFVIRNPNDFPIESPEMHALFQLNTAYQPVSMEIDPAGSRIIGAGQDRTMTLSWQLNWNDTFTLPGLLSGQVLPQNPTLKGSVNVDIGYGMVRVPFSLTAPVQLGN